MKSFHRAKIEKLPQLKYILIIMLGYLTLSSKWCVRIKDSQPEEECSHKTEEKLYMVCVPTPKEIQNRSKNARL